jgi:hypothetical protein
MRASPDETQVRPLPRHRCSRNPKRELFKYARPDAWLRSW